MSSLSARALATMLDGWRSVASAPAYMALADRVRLLILDGRISLGMRVPAERDLAAQLGVSRTTVTAAYTELREAGYLDSVRGSGSVARLPVQRAPMIEPLGNELLDFSIASLPALPAVVGAAQRAAQLLPAYLGSAGFDRVGLPVLRQAIADRYSARGLPTTPDQIMVTLGAQHAIALLARTLLSRGDRALVESPSYPHAFEALRNAGARLVPVAVTSAEGWDTQGFEQSIARTSPSIGYLMPDFHNPTGASMTPEFRERALALAERHGTALIADETMADLAIDEMDPVLPFAAYGPEGNAAILVGSVGKTVWGGLRVGWVRARPRVIQQLVRARAEGDLGTPALEQLIVADLLGDYDSLLAIRRTQLRQGRDRMARLLADRLPEWSVPYVTGGVTTWVNIGVPVSSQLALAARGEGLQIAAGPRFGMDGAFERFLRIPLGHTEAEQIRGVDALANAWASVGRYSVAESDLLAEVV
ncbi:PLP-dependent aminotransferase family protein [Glaciihabitans sp. dw_435]|uniref:MocR-like transcription factor YczR n=1 Tax=Glaciihabitans sp. dw_435 TaxID=2720081 RepID=UPI001BD2E1EF|nr:PLP-dependent aminotransferase family protein [Glaciihabitans sp. dw_435]